MGACIEAAATAPIPTKAYEPGVATTSGKIRCPISPMAPPNAAPINNEGANTPPEPPEPIVIEVANNLQKLYQ